MATVLLVEDDPAARQGLELALRRLGYGVRAAETVRRRFASSATPPRTSWCST
jgi:DNA-binding response OmpR family regulator